MPPPMSIKVAFAVVETNARTLPHINLVSLIFITVLLSGGKLLFGDWPRAPLQASSRLVSLDDEVVWSPSQEQRPFRSPHLGLLVVLLHSKRGASPASPRAAPWPRERGAYGNNGLGQGDLLPLLSPTRAQNASSWGDRSKLRQAASQFETHIVQY